MLALAMAAPIPDGVVRRQGRLASGSIFVDAPTKQAMADKVWAAVGLPDAVEMENAGVAQICKAYGVPYVSIRALSDLITGDANADFNAFCQQAADNAFPIVRHIAKSLP
jgi:adenosylhomocysteine nucleosidase